MSSAICCCVATFCTLVRLLADKPEAKAIGEYLDMVDSYRRAWHDLTMPLDERLKLMDTVVAYLQGNAATYPNNHVTDEVLQQVTLSTRHLRLLTVEYCKASGQKLERVSYLSTLVVEHFFSRMRSKIRFPSLWQFACTYQAAWRELVKDHAKDFKFARPSPSRTKYYGALPAQFFNYERDAGLVAPKKRREVLDALRSANRGSDADAELCSLVARRHRPTRRVITIREATCKGISAAPGVVVNIFPCNVGECPRIYKYRKACYTHRVEVHGLEKDAARRGLGLPASKSKSAVSAMPLAALTTAPTTGTDSSPPLRFRLHHGASPESLFTPEYLSSGEDVDELDDCEADELAETFWPRGAEPLPDVPDSVALDCRETWRVMVADFEYASPSRLAEVACIDVLSGRSFKSLVKPLDPTTQTMIPLSPMASSIHGISEGDLADAPVWPQVLASWRRWVAGFQTCNVLVLAHNAKSDLAVLAKESAVWKDAQSNMVRESTPFAITY